MATYSANVDRRFTQSHKFTSRNNIDIINLALYTTTTKVMRHRSLSKTLQQF